MRKLLFALSAAGIAAAACAQQRQNMYKETSDNRILIAYFSATGTTARAAERLAEATGGTLYAIVPARPYTPDDLDWHDKRSRSSAEMNDPQARPAIGGRQPDTEDYDTVFIGYPIWWDLAPRIIDTFIESHDLKGKTVIRSPRREGAASPIARRPWRENPIPDRTGRRKTAQPHRRKSLREWAESLQR